MTQIIKRISKIQIIIAINPALGTRETATTVEGTLTMPRMATRKSHQMLWLPSRDP